MMISLYTAAVPPSGGFLFGMKNPLGRLLGAGMIPFTKGWFYYCTKLRMMQ